MWTLAREPGIKGPLIKWRVQNVIKGTDIITFYLFTKITLAAIRKIHLRRAKLLASIQNQSLKRLCFRKYFHNGKKLRIFSWEKPKKISISKRS